MHAIRMVRIANGKLSVVTMTTEPKKMKKKEKRKKLLHI